MLTCAQLRGARAILRLNAIDVAKRAGVSLSTIQRAERSDGPVPMIPATADRVRGVLEDAGITLLPDEAGTIGLRFREPGQ